MGLTNDGYIYLWKQILNTSFYTNPNACHLAIHLLLKANWEEKKIVFDGRELVIKRGEHLTGRKKLSEETGLSEQEIRTSIKILKKVGFLTSKSTNQFSIISIVKYDQFQTSSTKYLTNQQPATNQPLTSQEAKEKRKEKRKENSPYVSPIRKEIRKEIKKEVNIKNNILPKGKASPQKGNPKVNQLIEKFTQLFGEPQPKKQQRYYCSTLLKKYSVQKLLNAIEYANEISGDRYAPAICTPKDLFYKLSQLSLYKKKNNQSSNVIDLRKK